MGLSVALNNALSGMRVGQNGLDVVSRNVANSGTPGYHKQSINVIDTQGANSPYARSGMVTRAFNQSLQQHFTRTTSDTAYAGARANMLDRLQGVIGKPGAPGSLDLAFNRFHAALSNLATSPESYAARAEVVTNAQALAASLNGLSGDVQLLRRETEERIDSAVADFNRILVALEKVNLQLGDQDSDPTSRAAMMDQRDRLVAQVAEMIDVRADYRPDGTVSLMTRSGVGILDGQASVMAFQRGGALSATSQFNTDPAQSGVGQLVLRTPSGLTLDLVQQNVLRSGSLGALIEMRDVTLVQSQDQLDQIAASLAQSMSTMVTPGTAVTGGFVIDLAGIRNGNDFLLSYREGAADRTVRVVRVDDTSKLPLDTLDAAGQRVIGLDFSGGAASVAAQLQAALGSGLSISSPGGTQLQVLDDGLAGTTDVNVLASRGTVTGTQGQGLALSLFVDAGNADFTDHLNGVGQRRGFAARISVNSDVLADASLVVQQTAGGSMGDADRATYLREQLDRMTFASSPSSGGRHPAHRLSGTVSDIIGQVINFQGSSAAAAIAESDAQTLTMETLNQRMDAEYGVDVDEEMARLIELQNAFAANARIVSVVQELLDQLMRI